MADIELRGITKQYGDLLAADDVSLGINRGEVTAIVGENGAGKSTVVKVLAGVVEATRGEIRVDGNIVSIPNARIAAQNGIGMVFQEMALVPALTVWENIALGWETTDRGMVDRASCIARVNEVSNAYRLPVKAEAIIQDLPVSVRQRVEILKVLYRDASVVILDEPTGILTPQEAEGLFDAIEQLREKGNAVVFISHKLNEVLRIADTIHVMRRGKLVATTEPGEMRPADLASLMLGEQLPSIVSAPRTTRQLALEMNNVIISEPNQSKSVGPINEKLHYGEVLGIAGVAGSGQDELVGVLSGQISRAGGGIRFIDEKGTFEYPVQSEGLPQVLANESLHCVPSDRNETATVPSKPLWFSAVASRFGDESLYRRGLMDVEKVKDFCREIFAKGNVKAENVDQLPGELSGGNLQKFIVAREIIRGASVLITEEPTRGIDVGSAYGIRQQIRDLADAGSACLVVSSDLDEIFQICDRIMVMCDGQHVGTFERSSVTLEEIGAAMTGLGIAGVA